MELRKSILSELSAAANVETDQMDVDKILQLLLNLFDAYRKSQIVIVNLNHLAKLDLKALPAMRKWLEADKDCLADLDRLEAWPEAVRLKKITDATMAVNVDNWTTLIRVNF